MSFGSNEDAARRGEQGQKMNNPREKMAQKKAEVFRDQARDTAHADESPRKKR